MSKNKVDRRQGKRPLSSDQASEDEKSQDFSFPLYPSLSHHQTQITQESSPYPFPYHTTSTFPIPQVTTSSALIENNSSSQPISDQGKLSTILHHLLPFLYLYLAIYTLMNSNISPTQSQYKSFIYGILINYKRFLNDDWFIDLPILFF